VLKLAVEFLMSGILMLVVLSRVILVLTVSCVPCIRGILIRKKTIKEPRKSVKANVPTHKPEKWHESMNSSYITQLGRKIRDRDNTIKLMERRLTQLEQNQDTPNTRDGGFCSGDSVTRYIVSAFPSSDFVDI
jgi:hypothetical protein